MLLFPKLGSEFFECEWWIFVLGGYVATLVNFSEVMLNYNSDESWYVRLRGVLHELLLGM